MYLHMYEFVYISRFSDRNSLSYKFHNLSLIGHLMHEISDVVSDMVTRFFQLLFFNIA